MTEQQFLTGKTVLVTGSVQGIGLAIATALGEAGANVALHGLAGPDQARAAIETVRKAGSPKVDFFDADLSVENSADTLMDDVLAWGNGIDVLVNNAGIQKTAPLTEVEPETWAKIIEVNLSAAFRTMRRAMPGMAERGYGRVINIASVHGLVASQQKASYVASKFGLVGLSRVAALEYASAGSRKSGGVTVNCICPGWTETAIIEPQIVARAAQFDGNRDAGIRDLLTEKQPTQRTSDAAEIGALALWLCNPVAHNITGTSIPIDGGWTAQ